MKVALINPHWNFQGSIYFGCREPHLPLEFGVSKQILEAAGHTARLIDGGSLTVGAETYRARDTLLGVLDGLEALTEGVGDEAPAAVLRFLPPDDADAETLNNATASTAVDNLEQVSMGTSLDGHRF